MKLKPKASQPDSHAQRVSVGHNRDIQQVVMIFGNPAAEPLNFVSFSPDQARGIGNALLLEADKAQGKLAS